MNHNSISIFVGRDLELRILNDLNNEDRFQSVPVTGRHRVGKSKKIGANGMIVRYALFSRSGYTKVAEMRAEMEGISLHRFDDMF